MEKGKSKPRTPAEVALDALKKAGVAKPKDELGPEELELMKELNEAQALLREEASDEEGTQGGNKDND